MEVLLNVGPILLMLILITEHFTVYLSQACDSPFNPGTCEIEAKR